MSFNFRNRILFAAIWMLSQQQVIALSDYCITSNGIDGICVPVYDCPVIKTKILQRILSHQDTTCGWKDAKIPLVCCPTQGSTTGNNNKMPHPIDKKKDPPFTLTKDNLHMSPPPPIPLIRRNMNLEIRLASDICRKEVSENDGFIEELPAISPADLSDDFVSQPAYGDLQEELPAISPADLYGLGIRPLDGYFQEELPTISPADISDDFVSDPVYDYFQACGTHVYIYDGDTRDYRKVYCVNDTADKYKELGYTVTPLEVRKDMLIRFQVSNSTHKKYGSKVTIKFASGYGGAAGGRPARRVVTVYMALLGYTTADRTEWKCDGVIINRNWILTAAHCLNDRDPDVIRLGEYDLGNDTVTPDAFPMDFGVEKYILHPNYNPPSVHHDLALIRLNKTIPFYREDMTPVCLPWGNEANRNLITEHLTLTGWGETTYQGKVSPILQEVNVTGFDASVCDKSYSTLSDYPERFPNGIRPENALCAGDPEGGKDACQGDSGGPLVYLNGYQYTLAGIVSAGNGCGSKEFPGIYIPINIPDYLRWIKKIAFS